MRCRRAMPISNRPLALSSFHTSVDQPFQNANWRNGAATLDYILLLGVILPLVAFVMPTGKRIIQLTYEMICTLIAWPFL